MLHRHTQSAHNMVCQHGTSCIHGWVVHAHVFSAHSITSNECTWQVGELIGGSQREDRYDVLKQRIEASGMDLAPYE